MRMPLTVTFGQSPSPLYPGAVGLAQRLAGYRRAGETKETVHTVGFN